MPRSVANTRKLNLFQRLWRNVQAFRQRYPYWFAFIVGLGVGLLAATALAVMIFVPPLTPAFLAGAAAFAAHMGVLVIPTAIGAFIGITMAVGSMFAAAKGIFNGLFGRKPLLLKTTPLPGSKLGSKNTIKATVDIWDQTSTTPRSSTKLTQAQSQGPSTSGDSPTYSSGVSEVTTSQTGSRKGSSSSSESLTDSPATLFAAPVSPEKTPKQYYQEAAQRHQETKGVILKHFNEAIRLVENVPAKLFADIKAKGFMKDRVTQMRNAFSRGELTAASLRGAAPVEAIGFTSHAWQNIPEQKEFSEVLHQQVALVHNKLAEIKAMLDSPDYQKFVKSEQDLAMIYDTASNEVLAVHSALNPSPKYHSKIEVDTLEKQRDTLDGTIGRTRKERIHEVYGRFVPVAMPAAHPITPSLSQ